MTTPISITTRQTEDLIRKWPKVNKTNQTLLTIAASFLALFAIIRVIRGISNLDWMEWVNAGLMVTTAILLFLSAQFSRFFFTVKTTTVTFTDQDVSISIDKDGKTKGYSVEWRKVRIHESSDCFYFQVNWRQMQIFRKEDLTDCTAEELSAFLCSKIGKRYVKF
ncbi:MAG: hypothetical protein IJW98_04685 [Clostridia bacterium]|nr:hypothetical protein [Clostridia bacterium]